MTDLNGGDVERGDVLRYAVTTRNDGDDAAVGLGVTDAVPAGTTLVPGSLTGPGGTAAARRPLGGLRRRHARARRVDDRRLRRDRRRER